MWIWLAAYAAIVFLTEAFLHCFSWNRLLGHELEPPWTYVVGLIPLLTAFSLWAFAFIGWAPVVGIWLICGAGGLPVVALYAFDGYLAKKNAKWLLGGDVGKRGVEGIDGE
jgi:hypothetical protein